ncbi:hypothetical protein B296_00026753 [Ensete ventricosum]|uniref:Uncharacterized protein n=1 Tax=Ensete ventricosum TaxID=4639 RepID=A0A427AAM8_ENSVE|nr:hypothetical protein B296_00026753 [Ensete ventricosum]
MREVEFRSVFRSPSRKLKMLAIPNILVHGKSYEYGFAKKHDVHKHCAKSQVESNGMHGFTKKRDGHKLYTKLSFDRFFVHRLFDSKYKPFPTYYPMGSHPSMVSRKNTKVINFVQSHARSRVSIDFSCTVSKFKIQAIPIVLTHGNSYEHVSRKNVTFINFSQSRVRSGVSIGLSCTVSEIQNDGHSQPISLYEVI